jgi:hypothetical protein
MTKEASGREGRQGMEAGGVPIRGVGEYSEFPEFTPEGRNISYLFQRGEYCSKVILPRRFSIFASFV